MAEASWWGHRHGVPNFWLYQRTVSPHGIDCFNGQCLSQTCDIETSSKILQCEQGQLQPTYYSHFH